jgi:hypothetical protein
MNTSITQGRLQNMALKSLFTCIVAMLSFAAYGQNSHRCIDDGLDLDLIHSDPEAFDISMDMDTRGNL